ncbi:hypothetical protein [Kordia sp.]|uniref:hypothetical protein n=1 Tax=Kordia sp. TaxID=1965332 RepID=UPI003B5949CF
MIRVLKILLILSGLFCFGGLSVIVYILLTNENNSGSIIAYLSLALVYMASIVNLVYHIKSFQFYKKKENITVAFKVSKVFWIGAIVFNGALLVLFGYALYDYLRLMSYGIAHQLKDVLLLVFMLVSCVLGFLELSLLKNRLKKLRLERHTKDEIDEIGSSTI